MFLKVAMTNTALFEDSVSLPPQANQHSMPIWGKQKHFQSCHVMPTSHIVDVYPGISPLLQKSPSNKIPL